ncbi:MAG TPA: hypothetical protein VFB58_14770 [Chloroflexota bacterium]|nr:hypothetical protein [Chloroflexota bacterium]
MGRSLASLVSALFDPPIVASALLLVLTAHHMSSRTIAVRWAFVAVLFAGVIPLLYIAYEVETHHFRGFDVPARRNRPGAFAMAALSGVAGFIVLLALGAPADLLAALATVVLGLLGAAAISLFWKISVHTSTVSGAISILAVAVSPAYLLLLPLVPLVAWARLRTGAHRPSQVVTGALAGACGGPVFWVIRAFL